MVKGNVLNFFLKENAYFAKRNRKIHSTKVVCHYCGDKGYIRYLCHIRNIKVPNV